MRVNYGGEWYFCGHKRVKGFDAEGKIIIQYLLEGGKRPVWIAECDITSTDNEPQRLRYWSKEKGHRHEVVEWVSDDLVQRNRELRKFNKRCGNVPVFWVPEKAKTYNFD